MKSDEQLVVCYRDAGQPEALDELVSRHLIKVRAVIYPMVLDHSLADDLTQETFVNAFRALAGFRGRSRFSTWLYRVAINTVYGFLDRRDRCPVVFKAQLPDRPLSPGVHSERSALRSELDSAIEVALRALPPKLRAAIVLTVMEGLTVQKAAHVEGCAVGTMYWRIHEARNILKQRLERFLYHEHTA